MKKVILMSALLSLAIMSCKKEEEETTPQNDVLSEKAVGKYFASAGATGTPIEAKLLGGITKTTNHKGVADAAWQFDGVDDRIEIADDAKFKPAAFTIAMRVYAEDIESRIGILAFKGATSYDYFLSSEINAIVGVQGNGGLASQTSTNNARLQNNKWHHLAATADSDSVKLYVDGTKRASKATKFNIRTTISSLFLGYATTEGPPIFYKGKMADVAFYGAVLTEAEILNISK
jgi:hypothetical protein